VSTYLLTFLLTVIIECFTALLMGFRRRWIFVGLFLVNLCTHPVLNLIIVYNNRSGLIKSDFTLLVLLEVVVVFAEYYLLRDTFRGEEKNLFLLSLLMNFNSFAAGLVLFWL